MRRIKSQPSSSKLYVLVRPSLLVNRRRCPGSIDSQARYPRQPTQPDLHPHDQSPARPNTSAASILSSCGFLPSGTGSFNRPFASFPHAIRASPRGTEWLRAPQNAPFQRLWRVGPKSNGPRSNRRPAELRTRIPSTTGPRTHIGRRPAKGLPRLARFAFDLVPFTERCAARQPSQAILRGAQEGVGL
jgi:hypothetical protein